MPIAICYTTSGKFHRPLGVKSVDTKGSLLHNKKLTMLWETVDNV